MKVDRFIGGVDPLATVAIWVSGGRIGGAVWNQGFLASGNGIFANGIFANGI